MATTYEITRKIEEQGFENYMKEKMINKWRNQYFPYSKVKTEILKRYQIFLQNFKEEGKRKGSGVEVVFFKDNETYLGFINEVDSLIKSEFSKVNQLLS